MKLVVSFLSLVLLLAASAPALAVDRVLIVGRTSIVPLQGPLLEIDNRKPNVVSVEPSADGDALLVSGAGEGSTILRYTLQNGRTHRISVAVLPFNPMRIRAAIVAELDGLEHVDARYVGGCVIIDGQVSLDEDVQRIESLAEKYDSILVNEVEFTRVTLDALALAARREIGLASVKVWPDGEELVLEGTVANKKAAARAERIARRHHYQVRNELRVRPRY